MRLQRVPARQGIVWVRQGFRVFFSRPMAFAGLFAAFLFAILVLMLVPVIGLMLALAALPFGSLVFMIATRDVLESKIPTPALLLLPFKGDKRRRNALIKIGLASAVGAFAVAELSNLIDGGAFENLVDAMSAGQVLTDDTASQAIDGGLMMGVVVRFGLVALLSVPFWHAPALVYWDGHGWGKALFSSTAAVWSNKGAFAVYGFTWMAVIMIVGTLTNLLFALLGQLPLLSYAMAPISLILSTVFYVSLYFTFADSFSPSEPTAVPTASITT